MLHGVRIKIIFKEFVRNMNRMLKSPCLATLPFAIVVLTVCCARPKNEVVWDQNFPVIGSQSSPRAADLNQDGVLDIVMGAGKNEFQSCKQGILALDGKTGDVLWQQEAHDQVYGSATFCDITGDGIKD